MCLLILSLRIPLFVAPNEVRDASALACLGKTKRKARLGKTLWEAVAPSRKARGLLARLRPERNEGGFALLGRIVRHDNLL